MGSPQKKNNTVLLIGNFFSRRLGTHGVSEELAVHFKNHKMIVYCTSLYVNRLFRLLDVLVTIWKLKKNNFCAIVEVYSDLAFLWAEFASFWLHVFHKPFLLTLHGGKLPVFAKKRVKRFRKLLLAAKAVTTPSKYLLHEFQNICPSIRYIPNGVDLAHYSFTLRSNIRPNIVWLRAFHTIYSPEMAVKAMKVITEKYPQTKLIMIGPDKHDGSFAKIKELVCTLGLEERVIFTGAVAKEDVGEHLMQGDIFLNTTNYESFGVSVLEAAACGLCIVSTNVGELPYLWEDGTDALLVPPNDAEAMSRAVLRILSDPHLAKSLSSNARKKAERYDWSSIIPQWLELIDSVMGEHGD